MAKKAAAVNDRLPDGRRRPGPNVRMEHCDGCQEMTASSAIRNVKGSDEVWRALCPRCLNEGAP